MKRLGSLSIAWPAVVFLSCFGGVLLGRRTFLFRDSGHYYFPLWRWIAEHWRRGEFPLWNPLENAGVSLAADATASLFYPGKLLFLLPLPLDTAYNLFLLAHFVLAGWLTYRAARHLGLAASEAVFAAMAYTFSGAVLMQHANAPYLIGAAWLPLAVSAAYGLVRERRWRDSLGLALALAMMILGGDVQTAYHALLVLGLTWWMLRRRGRLSPPAPNGWHRSRLVLAGAACCLAGGLAAVQILPAREATANSTRAMYRQPRNLFELAVTVSDRGAANNDRRPSLAAASRGLFGSPLPGSHHESSYHFSVGPWRWAELVWPNLYGKLYPVNQRWLSALPGEGRVWTPSLYLGLLPFVMAWAVFRLRRGDARWRWLSWLALLSLLAALGWHGVGWVVHEAAYALGGEAGPEPSVGPQVGGLYWLFSTVLPGYAYFRFPAKWLTVASLAISLLAGHGLQLNLRRLTIRAGGTLLAVMAIGLLVAVGLLLMPGAWRGALAGAPVDPYFGPLDVEGARRDALLAVCHAAAFAAAGYLLLRRKSWQLARSVRISLLAAITAVDLAVAQSWMTPTAPAALWQTMPEAAAAIDRHRQQHGIGPADQIRLSRSNSPRLLPPAWSEASSPRRLVDGMAWERDTLHPKHYLTAGLASIDGSSALIDYHHAAWLAMARAEAARPANRSGLEALSVDYLILPAAAASQEAGAQPLSGYSHVALVPSREPWPRVRVARDVVRLPQLTEPTAAAIDRRTREVMRLMRQSADAAQAAVLEADDPLLEEALQHLAGSAIGAEEHAEIVAHEPNRVVVEVQLAAPALLVLADSYAPAWNAHFDGREGKRLPVYRTNRLFRGVLLPAGEHRVVFHYAPRSLQRGMWISGASWLLLSLAGGAVLRRNVLTTKLPLSG